MDRMLAIIAQRPGLVLATLLIITALAVGQLFDLRTGRLNLGIDPAIGRLLPADDPERALYDRVSHIFGSDESVLVAVTTNDAFGEQNLDRIDRMDKRLRKLPKVYSVLSLTTASSLRADESGIEFGGIEDRDFSDPAERERLRSDILDNPLYKDTLVSADLRVTVLVVAFKSLTDKDFIDLGISDQIYAIAEQERGDESVWVSGSPVIKAAISGSLMDSFQVMLPSILGIVSLVLLIAFRSLRAVLLPVLAILIALSWTLGLMVLLDRPLNVVTTLVPPLIITLGLAFGMHVISEYYSVCESTAALQKQDIVLRVLRHVGLPLIISAATTVAGLTALSLNTLSAIREFSLFSVIGVIFAVIVVMTFIPASLCFLSPPRGSRADTGNNRFHRVARRLVDFDTRNRRPIILAGLIALAIAFVGTTRIEVGTEYIGGFAQDTRVRTDYEAINNAFGGANFFYVLVESEHEDTFVEPDNLDLLESLQLWLMEQQEVGSTTSLVDHVKLINQTLHDGDSEFYVVPDSKQLAKQLLLFGGSEDIDNYVDNTYRITSILVRVNVDDTRDISRLVERIHDRLTQLPYPLQASVSGNLMLSTRTVEDIASGQLVSISVALLVVWLILSLMFTSLRVGCMALFPNVLTIAIYFGTLGLLGITLNPTTSLIACIALGIAVDDTIHFMVRFNIEARASGQEGSAVQRALEGVIRPVTYTSIVLVFSFLVLTTSDLRTQVHFGALAAFTIAVAWLIDLTLTPALSSGMRIVTLWDVLRLDLGSEPQNSIPLFGGLSLGQARIFALMSNVSHYQRDDRIFAEGEQASDEVFVIIDGELSAWIERDGRKIQLSRMTRGTVVGEGGAFGQLRSSNVDTLTDARLLRFTMDDLERLRQRNPRIAAVVYRNLNRIQAERMARDVARVQA